MIFSCFKFFFKNNNELKQENNNLNENLLKNEESEEYWICSMNIKHPLKQEFCSCLYNNIINK